MTRYVIRYLLDNCPDELAFFNQFFDKGLIERLELVANPILPVSLTPMPSNC